MNRWLVVAGLCATWFVSAVASATPTDSRSPQPRPHVAAIVEAKNPVGSSALARLTNVPLNATDAVVKTNPVARGQRVSLLGRAPIGEVRTMKPVFGRFGIKKVGVKYLDENGKVIKKATVPIEDRDRMHRKNPSKR